MHITGLTALTGGISGALDYMDGGLLSDGDTAEVRTSAGVFEYRLNASSGESESSPSIVTPDSNAGTKAWELQAVNAPYPCSISGMFNGTPTNGLVLLRVPIPKAVTFPVSLTGSYMIADTAATAETVFSLKKNGTEFGTATFAASGTSATMAATSETSFAAGDILTMVGPATADATLADLGWAIVGCR